MRLTNILLEEKQKFEIIKIYFYGLFSLTEKFMSPHHIPEIVNNFKTFIKQTSIKRPILNSIKILT
jgi:ATP sulfurylase